MKWNGAAEERVALVRRLFDGAADHEIALDIYADDLYWSMPKGRGTLMGERHGRAAVTEAVGHVMEVAAEYHSSTEGWEILADDRDTISFNRDWSVRRSAATPSSPATATSSNTRQATTGSRSATCSPTT